MMSEGRDGKSDCRNNIDESVWHWSLLCLAGIVVLGYIARPAIVLVFAVFGLHLVVMLLSRRRGLRRVLWALTGAIVSMAIAKSVAAGVDTYLLLMRPLLVGGVCGFFAAGMPSMFRFFVLSLCFGLCAPLAMPDVPAIGVLELFGFNALYNSRISWVLGLFEMFVLGIPGVVYCMFSNRLSIGCMK